ncbi:hypothetical protein [Pedobacter insulae]|uniref:Uncharacterized protein n=1 Tax=Pedobacter insulae TaxID=414048 RepID=A0A1I2XA65_9SPHI|nr:hypothetical protein [Pedobacter insulae]SFH09897.1 hypothetical protein SAMN04489864_10571 [Pedobacter insulae]
MKNLFFFISTMLILSSCGNNKKEAKTVSKDTAEVVNAPETTGLTQQDSIKATARQILVLLKENNIPELTKYFSNNGVLFSPYGHIDTIKSKKLHSADLLAAINNKWILTWGNYDGTGEPIKLTVPAYLKKFAYSADYLNAEAVGYDELIKEGNSLNNIKEIYPNHHFVDYHFSGFDQKYEGMDWTSLRLVFEKQNGEYCLVAVIHDQWTV